MGIDPQQSNDRQPPDCLGVAILVAVQEIGDKGCQGKAEHLRPGCPDHPRGGGCNDQYKGTQPTISTLALEPDKGKCRGHQCSNQQRQTGVTEPIKEQKENNLCQPAMIYPRLAKAGVGERVYAGDSLVLHYPATGLQVPPGIAVNRDTHCHGENGDEYDGRYQPVESQ